MKKLIFNSVLVFTLVMILSATLFAAKETKWPLEISSEGGELTVYQPQLDSLEKNTISARSAVSVKLSKESEPIFGAVWITSRISTDRETRMAILENIKIERIKFPDDVEENLKSLTSVVEQGLPKDNIKISLDKINAMLELVKKEEAVSKEYVMKPPEIIFSTNPTVLVSIDGTPKLKPVEGKKLMRVINSMYTILLDTETKTYYLGSGENWVSSSDILDNWVPSAEIPEVIKSFDNSEKETAEEIAATGDVLPKVIVRTEPAELIVIEGEPEFSPIRGTDLLYVENTEANVFMEIGSQEIFLLLSGRWYSSENKKGPWKYVASDKLPGDFAKIPPGSAKGEVLTQISGTEEASDAVLDSYIPQTAAIARDETNLVVAFDGEPEFEKIEGTEMEYAVNSQEQIIQVEDKYYCCKGGVWYVTDKILTTAGGAVAGVLQTAENITETALNLTFGTIWGVCNVVPPVIYTIPPSCPVYPVTYCRVYDYTPEVVYVGYTPGYVGSYRYGGCMVYGTGYRYNPWCGRYYWPRPCTFGFSVSYNSRSGWGFGVGYGAAYGGVSFSWGSGGWYGHGYGHRGYGRHRGHHGYRSGNVYVDNSRNYKHEQNIYNNRRNKEGNRGRNWGRRETPSTRDRKLSDARNRNPSIRDRKIADSPRKRDISVPSTRDSVRKKQPTKRNNVITDRKGNVYKRNLDGWQTRNNNSWNSSKKPTQTHKNLNNQYKARQRGTTSTRNYQQSRPQTRPSSSRSFNSRPASRPAPRPASRPAPSRSNGRRSFGEGRRR